MSKWVLTSYGVHTYSLAFQGSFTLGVGRDGASLLENGPKPLMPRCFSWRLCFLVECYLHTYMTDNEMLILRKHLVP